MQFVHVAQDRAGKAVKLLEHLASVLGEVELILAEIAALLGEIGAIARVRIGGESCF